MANNQRGGIISNLLLIPAGVALMLGFFFLGYYVGSHKAKDNGQNDPLPQLPDVVSKNLPKPDEFTFYKTLSEKEGKTVSVDLKPKGADSAVEKTEEVVSKTSATETKREKKADVKAGSQETAKKNIVKPAAAAKAETKTASAKNSLRYTLQVSSHPERGSAEQEVKRMKQSGFAAFIVASSVPGKGTWYRVRVGSFSSRNAAEKLGKELQAKAGVSPIITLE